MALPRSIAGSLAKADAIVRFAFVESALRRVSGMMKDGTTDEAELKAAAIKSLTASKEMTKEDRQQDRIDEPPHLEEVK